MNTKLLIPAFLVGVLAAGCSDTGSTGGKSLNNIKVFRGAQVTAVTDGTIQLDNSTALDTQNASVTLDDNSSAPSDLKPGMIVNCKAHMDSDSTGTAMEVEYHDELEGTIDSIDNDNLVVMGQAVVKTAATKIEGDLVVGAVVEVSGAFDGTAIVATRIEVKNAEYRHGDDMEIKGFISALDTASFKINDLTVIYDDTTKIEHGSLADGLFVKVTTKVAVTDKVMIAHKIEVKNPLGDMNDEDADEMEIKGTVVTVTANDAGTGLTGMTVDVRGATKTIVITADTMVRGDIAAFIAGAFVEVEGTVNDDGSITAHKVELEHYGDSGMSDMHHTDTGDSTAPPTSDTTMPPSTSTLAV